MSLTSLHVLWQPTLGPLFEQSSAYGCLICLLITYRATFVTVDFSSFCLSLSPFVLELPALLPSYHVLFTESVCPEAFISPRHGNPGLFPLWLFSVSYCSPSSPGFFCICSPSVCCVQWIGDWWWSGILRWVYFCSSFRSRGGLSMFVLTPDYVLWCCHGGHGILQSGHQTDAHIQVTKGKWGSTKTNFT